MYKSKKIFQCTENRETNIRKKFSIISFVCSLFVIYIHALNLGKYGIDENSVCIGHITYVIETYAGYIIGIAVPMFYFISAILFFRTFDLRNLLKKWKTRVFTILIPYLIWCCLHYLYFVVYKIRCRR